MTFKAVFCDLDNTLYPYDPAHQAGLSAALTWLSHHTQHTVESLQAAYDISRHTTHTRLKGTAASHHRLLYFQGLCESLSLPLFVAYEATELYWETFLNTMVLFPGCMAFINRLHYKQIPLVIVTDLVADIQFRKIKTLGLSTAITFLVTSEEAGFDKPHPSPFRLALDKVSLHPHEVCMIGDDLKKDVEGAENLGITGFHFQPEKGFEPLYEGLGL